MATEARRRYREDAEQEWRDEIIATADMMRVTMLPILPLTRAPLGYSAERPRWGGGGQILPPLPNSRTNRRSEAGEAAIESPEREDSNAH